MFLLLSFAGILFCRLSVELEPLAHSTHGLVLSLSLLSTILGVVLVTEGARLWASRPPAESRKRPKLSPTCRQSLENSSTMRVAIPLGVLILVLV